MCRKEGRKEGRKEIRKERKEGRKEEREERRKEGKKERRRGGMEEGRKEGRKERHCKCNCNCNFNCNCNCIIFVLLEESLPTDRNSTTTVLDKTETMDKHYKIEEEKYKSVKPETQDNKLKKGIREIENEGYQDKRDSWNKIPSVFGGL